MRLFVVVGVATVLFGAFMRWVVMPLAGDNLWIPVFVFFFGWPLVFFVSGTIGENRAAGISNQIREGWEMNKGWLQALAIIWGFAAAVVLFLTLGMYGVILFLMACALLYRFIDKLFGQWLPWTDEYKTKNKPR